MPHVGHALGICTRRHNRALPPITRSRTLLLCGGDENALKNVQAAEKANIPVQQFIDKNNIKFLN